MVSHAHPMCRSTPLDFCMDVLLLQKGRSTEVDVLGAFGFSLEKNVYFSDWMDMLRAFVSPREFMSVQSLRVLLTSNLTTIMRVEEVVDSGDYSRLAVYQNVFEGLSRDPLVVSRHLSSSPHELLHHLAHCMNLASEIFERRWHFEVPACKALELGELLSGLCKDHEDISHAFFLAEGMGRIPLDDGVYGTPCQDLSEVVKRCPWSDAVTSFEMSYTPEAREPPGHMAALFQPDRLTGFAKSLEDHHEIPWSGLDESPEDSSCGLFKVSPSGLGQSGYGVASGHFSLYSHCTHDAGAPDFRPRIRRAGQGKDGGPVEVAIRDAGGQASPFQSAYGHCGQGVSHRSQFCPGTQVPQLTAGFPGAGLGFLGPQECGFLEALDQNPIESGGAPCSPRSPESAQDWSSAACQVSTRCCGFAQGQWVERAGPGPAGRGFRRRKLALRS